MRIAIVTFPGCSKNVPTIQLSNLIEIIRNISENFHVITGKAQYLVQKKKESEMNIYYINNICFDSSLLRIINYPYVQFRIAYELLKLKNKVDSVVFFIGGDTLIIPIILLRLLRKEIIILVAGSSIKSLESKKDTLHYGLRLLKFVSCTCTDKILVYSESLIKDYSLEKWRKKIQIAHEHLIDFNKFRMLNEYQSRETIVGYVGRFSQEKGIMQLLSTIPAIIREKPEIKFILIGDGALKEEINQFISKNQLGNNVEMPGWIAHESLPMYLNQMKLLVIPSDTEGLPNIMLEAMACGTPVLATSVGAIPDFIIDGKTGFILENNSLECITDNVHRALNAHHLEQITEAGRRLVEDNFSFESTLAVWKDILNDG